MNLTEAKALYIKAKDAYYNTGNPIITDAQYDKLENWIMSKDPDWSELRKTGIRAGKIGKKQEIKLPFYMPSLNKFYPDEIDKLWTKLPSSHDYIYMAKLDGCSVLLEYEDAKPIRLITRGNGDIGKDISFLIPYLNLPIINNAEYHAFRCEAIISKVAFIKWQKEFDNARNMVSGILNRTQYHPALSDINFVVLGEYGKTLQQSLLDAKDYGLEVVHYTVQSANREHIILETVKRGMYEADGVVISTKDFKYKYDSPDKPKYGIFAYKENLEESEVEATVKKIHWLPSAFGKLIPKVEVNSVIVQGANVKFATCHNAQWLVSHKIGPGAIIKLIRSGEVIPKIVSVVSPAKELQLPDVNYYKKGVHFYQAAESDETYIKSLERMLVSFGIDGIKYKTLETLYNDYNSIFLELAPIDAIIKLSQQKEIKQELITKFGPKTGLVMFDSFSSILTAKRTIIDWLIATKAFAEGIGRKRLEAIHKKHDLVKMRNQTKEQIYAAVESTPGISCILANTITTGLLKFYNWFRQYEDKVEFKPIDEQEVIAGPMSGINVTFTGYRDQSQEKAIKELGGSIISFGANTTWLLYKAGGKASSKIAKAGDKAITWDDLVQKYPALPKAPSITRSLF